MIIAGFGFREATTEASLADALSATGVAVDAFATATDKAETPVFMALAATHGLPVIPINAADLETAQTDTQSIASQTHRATGSVSEAAALAAAGPGATLLVPRHISNDRMATCAIAQGPKP